MKREISRHNQIVRCLCSSNLALVLVVLGALLACLATPLASKQSAASLNSAAQPRPTPPVGDEDAIKADDEDGIWIKVVHAGAFIADFTVTWDEPGKKPQSRKELGKVNGFTTVFEIPAEAENIRLTITNDTGLVWQPKREIINRTLGPKDLNKCYKISGTTLGSKIDTSCTETEPDGDDTEETGSTKPWIKVVHGGAYIASITVTWDEPGKPGVTRQEAGKTAGFQIMLEFPAGTKNIRLNIENDTGLVWQPKRTIINRVLEANDMNTCFKLEGGTLNSSIAKNCQ